MSYLLWPSCHLQEIEEGSTSTSQPGPSRPLPSRETTRSPPRKWRRQSGPSTSNKADEVLGLIGETLIGSREEDQFDLFGKLVAAKLRSFSDDQRQFAEKIINDVLYDAQFGKLNYNSEVVNTFHL